MDTKEYIGLLLWLAAVGVVIGLYASGWTA